MGNTSDPEDLETSAFGLGDGSAPDGDFELDAALRLISHLLDKYRRERVNLAKIVSTDKGLSRNVYRSVLFSRFELRF